MSLAHVQPGSNLPAQSDEDPESVVGLEDFAPTNITIPQLKIVAADAEFEDGLTGDRLKEVEVVILGLNRQRVLWPPEMTGEKRPPLCRSLEGKTGTPTLETGPDGFPWKAAKLNRKTFIKVVSDEDSGEVKDVVLEAPIPCADCFLKEWNTHPRGGSPWCTEQLVLALLQRRDSQDGEVLWTPATLAISRSGMSVTNKVAQGYALTKQPMFIHYAKIGLTPMNRGTVNYAVPKYTKLGDTDKADYPHYREIFYQIRAFLQTPRDFTNSEDSDDKNGAAPTVPTTRGAAPANPMLDEPF